ncbi:uncharacterized protein GLRG_06658 [Colletotrichum graminicola M1.001]|uniref:Uncharacterized protein n=1 Tax=Colletotrichum graminicola (strain M1.001 / M2 / FGSC 10212) TaxID=645133 RepID=E3QLE5_COLGM|nr:uncharacterized protein GLRG_06658 [Colletotrichum graminicola M1.001]EFQ31683.1 hypothetical protein GLRG_06658 [Colletotrichum graminicola M1.001]
MVSFGRGVVASLFLVVATVPSVLSAPFNQADFAHPTLLARQGRVADKVEQLCNHDLSAESQDDVWWKTGVGLTLDLYVKRDYSNWVQNLDKFVWKKTQSDAWDCTSVPGKCGPPADCHEFRDIADNADEYWIFKAVTGAHKVINKLHEELQSQSDFSGSVKDLTDVYAKVAAVLNIGAGAASVLPGPGPLVGGALTSVAGIFGLAALDAPADPKPSANAYLETYFKQARTALEDLARNLFGTGDQNKLPNVQNSYQWTTPVAQFFGGGRFLIEDVDKYTSATVNTSKKHLRQAIGMSVLGSHGWKLFIETGVKSQGDCTKAGGSRIWKGGVNDCWGLLKWTSAPLGDLFSNKKKIQVEHLPGNIVEQMMKYEMDLPPIYDNAISCKLAQGGSERAIKVKDLSPNGGRLPECLFNIDVAKGAFTTFEYKAQDLWGKW